MYEKGTSGGNPDEPPRWYLTCLRILPTCIYISNSRLRMFLEPVIPENLTVPCQAEAHPTPSLATNQGTYKYLLLLTPTTTSPRQTLTVRFNLAGK